MPDTFSSSPPCTLKARCVFPVSSPPIPGGCITIQGERIVAVGTRPAGGRVEDLGEVAILPGLVNAHTHLDLSDVPSPLGEPGISLFDWVRRVMAFRLERPQGRPVEQGWLESLRFGTTTLADVTQADCPAEALEAAGRELTALMELIGPTPERIDPAMELAQRHLAAGRTAPWHAGLSPHAPYSVQPDLLARTVALSVTQQVPLAFHLAESPEELEWMQTAGGPVRTFLEEREAWHPSLVAPGTRPLDYLRVLQRAHRVLVVHGNYLDDEEIVLVAAHAKRMSIVYCPRTHAHFRHDRYPLTAMLAAGVHVALGTDSRASSPDLSILREMQSVARQHPDVAKDKVLRLGTLAGAEALGRDADVGSLEPGRLANLAVVSLPEFDAGSAHDALFDPAAEVVACWIRGRKWEAAAGRGC